MQNNNNRDKNINLGTDCLGCRLASGLGCLGIGFYLFAQSKNHKKLNKVVLQSLATGTFTIGSMRLLNIYPFNSKASNPSSDA